MSAIELDANGGDIIQTIKDSVKTETIDVKAGEFVTRPVHFAPRRDLAEGLRVSSLTGLVDYINKEIDGETRKSPFVVVDSPVCVSFYNDIAEDEERRFNPIGADADTPKLTFDTYLLKEEAMIMLQSRFVETAERNDLLAQLGTVIADEELLQDDDGVGQIVKTQRGIRRGEDKIINPNNLRPFRTFTEIEQPESPFIVRLRQDEQIGILVALFEADGGAWRNVARRSIKAYIDEAIKETGVPVIA